VADVLNTKVDPLLDVAVAHDLVYDHTDGRRCDVVNDSSSALHMIRTDTIPKKLTIAHPW
jgi:hypothetical protein